MLGCDVTSRKERVEMPPSTSDTPEVGFAQNVISHLIFGFVVLILTPNTSKFRYLSCRRGSTSWRPGSLEGRSRAEMMIRDC